MRLYDTIRSSTTLPVFAPGGPPRTEFAGPGRPTWSNPAFALHHAASWDSAFVLGYMLPLKLVATGSADELAGVQQQWISTLAEEAKGARPVVAQIWGPLSLLADAVGTSVLMHDIAHDSATVAGAASQCVARTELLTQAALDAGAHVIWIAEPMVALLDPVNVRMHITPPLSRLSAAVHSRGRDIVVHSSGSAGHALGGLAAARVDGVSITSGTPLETTHALPADVAVFGNLDRAELLDFDEERLAAEAHRMADVMSGRPFVATPGSALPSSTPVTHLAAFLDAARAEPGMLRA